MPTTRSASSERRRDGRGPSQPPRPNRRRDGSSPRVSVVSGCRWLQPLRTDTLRSETPRSSHRPSGWPHQVSAGAHRSRERVSRAQPRRRRGDPHGSERRPEQSRAEDPPRGRPPRALGWPLGSAADRSRAGPPVKTGNRPSRPTTGQASDSGCEPGRVGASRPAPTSPSPGGERSATLAATENCVLGNKVTRNGASPSGRRRTTRRHGPR
jgi:hypothetical protein